MHQNSSVFPWLGYLLQAVTQRPTVIQPLPTLVDWSTLITITQVHQLAPLLYWALPTLPPAEQPPPVIRQQLHKLHMAAAIQALHRERELRTVLSALHAAGVRPTLYKGVALANTVYPTPACRPMGDIDLWITTNEITAAQSALATLGYQQQGKMERPLALQQQQDGEIRMYGQQLGQSLIELHWGVFPGQWLKQVAKIDRLGVCQRRVPTELLGAPVYLLNNEDAIIQLAIHLSISHFLSLHPLRSLFDIALLAHQKVDWAVVAERTKSWRLVIGMSVVLDLLIDIFGAEMLPAGLVEMAAEIRPPAWRRIMYKPWGSAEQILRQKIIVARNRRFFYQMCMIDQPIDALRLFTHTLWPETEWLAARYGVVNHKVRLLHIKSALQGSV